MLKSASTVLVLVLSLSSLACKTSEEGQPLETSAPKTPQIVTDAEFDQVFFSKIVPFVEDGKIGYFTGSGGSQLEYVNLEKDGAKANVVFVHGFSQNFRSFSELMYNVWNNGYAVHSYTHLGHGCSEHPLLSAEDNKTNRENDCKNLQTKRADGKTYYKNPDYCKVHVEDYYTYLNDLKTFVDRVETSDRKTYLFCHSMGGGLCSRFIQDYPNAVDAVFLNAPMETAKSEPFPNWLAGAITKGAANLNPKAYVVINKEKPFEDFSFENFTDHTSRNRFEAELKVSGIETGDFRCGSTNAQARELLEVSRDVLQPQNLAKVTIPVTIAAGGEKLDRWVELSAIETFCKGIPTCRYRVYEDSRHEIYSEADAIRIPLMKDVLKFYSDPRGFIDERSKKY